MCVCVCVCVCACVCVKGEFGTPTDAHALLAGRSRPPVSAAAAVEAAKVAAAPAAAVKEAHGPALAVVAPVVRVLRAVRPRVRRERRALAAARGGAARVVVEAGGRRAALSAPETLRSHALSRKLSAHDRRAHEQEDAARKHDPNRAARNFYARTGSQVRLQAADAGLSVGKSRLVRRSERLLLQLPCVCAAAAPTSVP